MCKYYFEVAILRSPLQNLTYCYENIVQIGAIVEVKLRNRTTSAVVIKQVDEPFFKTIEIENITSYFYSSQNLQLATFISNYYVCSLGEALGVFTPFSDTKVEKDDNVDIKIDFELSDIQKQGLDFTTLHKTSLLFANTGSGKTEIYIYAISRVISQNKQAILLMPEISLTPMIEHRLKKVFGDMIAIWHSKITKSKKQKILSGIASSQIKIVAGARSALFLPFDNLGLIVVDEEHDNSYKSDSKPRYNAKDLAIYLSKKFDIQVILGSATPSINSFYKIPYFRITQTYYQTSKEIIYHNTNRYLDEFIVSSIASELQSNNQVIIFAPTRANYKYQICDNCAKAVECPFCSVAMSLHKDKLALICHYCNYIERIPNICPNCNNGNIKNYRVGTAQIEEELQALFPTHKIGRFDKDSVSSNAKLKKILKQFNSNEIDVLVGTQMITKGHDFHNVRLVVVIGIDSLVNMQSYNSREVAIATFMQIVGRSGRQGYGKVIVQTKNDELFRFYQDDYQKFLEDELQFRTNLYPPFVRIAKVIFGDKNPQKAHKQLLDCIERLESNNLMGYIIGYGECEIFKVANKYRYQVLFRTQNISKLLSILHYVKTPNSIIYVDDI